MTKTEYMLFKFKQHIENIGVAYETGLLSLDELREIKSAKLKTCDDYPQAIRDEMKNFILTWYRKYI